MVRHYLCYGEKYKERIIQRFRVEIEGRLLIVLDIPDNYQFMDPELIEEIKTKVDAHLNKQ